MKGLYVLFEINRMPISSKIKLMTLLAATNGSCKRIAYALGQRDWIMLFHGMQKMHAAASAAAVLLLIYQARLYGMKSGLLKPNMTA